MSEFFYLFVMAVLVFCAGWGAYQLVMTGRRLVYFSFLAGLGAFGVFFGLKMNASEGWDAVGYLAFLAIFVLPAVAGLVIGGAIGFYRRHRHG